MDGLDYLLLLGAHWRRLVLVPLLAAAAASVSLVVAPNHPSALPLSADLVRAQADVAELRQIAERIGSNVRDPDFWPSRDRLAVATDRLATLEREALRAEQIVRLREGQPGQMRSVAAVIAGLALAVVSVFLETWLRLSLRSRPLEERRAALRMEDRA